MPARYLKPNVVLEPLVLNWLAYWPLVSPLTASLALAQRQLPLMKSFAQYPKAHLDALKNPALAGGPFVNLGLDRVPEVKAWISTLETTHQSALVLAAAYKQLEALLATDKEGLGFQQTYAQVPEPLKGYVELQYDLQHRATARPLEGVLYRSPVSLRGAQAVRLSALDGSPRPFFLNTPRFEDPGTVLVRHPFDDPGHHALAAARWSPVEPAALAEQLGLDAAQRETFSTFFHDEAPRPTARYDGDGLRIRYLGHASVLLETRTTSVLLDPGVSLEMPSSVPRYSLADLPPRIDWVLVTHAHADHLSLEQLLQLGPRVGTIVVPKSGSTSVADPSLKLMLKSCGFQHVLELDELESLDLGDGGRVVGVPFFGEHCDLAIRTKLAYAVRLAGKTVLAMADSDPVEPRLYEHVRGELGPIDALFLGLESVGAPMSWGYGTLFATPLPRKVDQARRLNGSDFERAKAVITTLKPARMYAYAMGLEPWLGHIIGASYGDDSPQLAEAKKLLAYAQEVGQPCEKPYGKMELVLR